MHSVCPPQYYPLARRTKPMDGMQLFDSREGHVVDQDPADQAISCFRSFLARCGCRREAATQQRQTMPELIDAQGGRDAATFGLNQFSNEAHRFVDIDDVLHNIGPCHTVERVRSEAFEQPRT